MSALPLGPIVLAFHLALGGPRPPVPPAGALTEVAWWSGRAAAGIVPKQVRESTWTAAGITRIPEGSATAARPATTASGDRWLAEDKLKHFFMSMAVTTFAFAASRMVVEREPALGLGVGAGVAAGVGKEWWDAHHGGDPSARDLAWDALGVGAAAGLAAQVR